MRLPPRLSRKSDKADKGKRCPTCNAVIVRDTKRYSHQQWADKVFCSNACAQFIPMPERLIGASVVDQKTGCWTWQGTFSPDGYGRIVLTVGRVRTQHRAHRAAHECWNGPIPEGLMVLHSCDNPKCINPDHLRAGTHRDNMDDKVARKRCKNQHMEAAHATT